MDSALRGLSIKSMAAKQNIVQFVMEILIQTLLERTVFIVDFSYPRTILEEMEESAESLVVIDHHKTAEEDLRGLDYCHFDMTHSGAYLAWEYLFGVDNSASSNSVC